EQEVTDEIGLLDDGQFLLETVDHSPYRAEFSLLDWLTLPLILSPRERFLRTLWAYCACEPAGGPLTPSRCPSEGERVPEGRERGRFMPRGQFALGKRSLARSGLLQWRGVFRCIAVWRARRKSGL